MSCCAIPGSAVQHWNGGKLVDDMVKLTEDNYCVDTTHLFANGFSYGGGMSYCNRSFNRPDEKRVCVDMRPDSVASVGAASAANGEMLLSKFPFWPTKEWLPHAENRPQCLLGRTRIAGRWSIRGSGVARRACRSRTASRDRVRHDESRSTSDLGGGPRWHR